VQSKPPIKAATPTPKNSQVVTPRVGGAPVWHDFAVGDVLALASEGTVLWVATAITTTNFTVQGAGLLKFDANTGSILASYTITNSSLLDNQVNAIVVDGAGNKWFGTASGVSEFNGTTWTNYTSSNSGLVNNSVRAIVLDKYGNKWFGTSGGLSKFDGTSWTTYDSSNSKLSYDRVNSLAVDSNGAVWVANGGQHLIDCYYPGSVDKFDGTNWTNYPSYYQFPNNILIDPSNNVWTSWTVLDQCEAAGGGAFTRFDGTTWQNFDLALPSLGATSSYVDKDGSLWFGGSGIGKYDGVRWQSYGDPNLNNGQTIPVDAITIDGAGNKWFGGYFGLSELNDNGPGLGTNVNGLDFNYQGGGSAAASQNVSLSAYNFTVNWTTNIQYGAGASNWLHVSQSSGTTNPATPTSIAVSIPSGNLASGVYTATLSFRDINNTANQATINITLRVGFVYYLPAALYVDSVTKAFNHIVMQNPSKSVVAAVSAEYYDTVFGNSIAAQSTNCGQVAPLSECILDLPEPTLPFNMVLTSSQPLSVVLIKPDSANGAGSRTYVPVLSLSNSLIVPLVMDWAFNGFNTITDIFNAGSGVVSATIKVYDASGNLVATPSFSPYLTLAPHTITEFNYYNLPSGFYGWAQIESGPGSQLAAVTEEINSGFDTSFNAQATPATTLYAPTIFNTAFGNYNTGASIVNPNSYPINLTILYYDHTGKALPPAKLALAAHAILTIYHGDSQGSAGGNGIPAGGLPVGFYGSAIVKSSGSGVVMLVNELGPTHLDANGTTIGSNGTYVAVPAGSGSVPLPIMAKGGYGFNTGSTILNVSNISVGVTVQYYNLDGTPVPNGASSFTIAANGSQPVYQGAETHLPVGFYGTAVVTQTSGPANSLIVTTNAISPDTFYTYTEPGL
jgi:hypothetical protein